jgi:hypothetical protein
LINLLRELGGVARAIGFVNGFCGEALGTSAALCTVYEYSRCVTSPILRRGDRVIHFALQALQLHATPANPSPHTPRVKFKFKFKFKFNCNCRESIAAILELERLGSTPRD